MDSYDCLPSNFPDKKMTSFVSQLSSSSDTSSSSMKCPASGGEQTASNTDSRTEDIFTDTTDIVDLRLLLSKTKAENASLTNALERANALNNEKSLLISQLQKDSNVVLWEKEKARLFLHHTEREKELEERIKTLEAERKQMHEKIKNFSNQMKLEKMKAEREPKAHELNEELEKKSKEMERHIFMLEKDVKRMDTELHNQQKYIIGFFKGLKQDLTVILESHLADADIHSDVRLKLRWLIRMLSRGVTSWQQGTTGALRADLPDAYLATDAEVEAPTVKKISHNLSLRGIDKGRRDVKKMVSGDQSVKPRENPVLIDPATRSPNILEVMRHFPNMTKENILDQWNAFRNYDIDNSGWLDITETMTAMSKTIGQQFTGIQIKEAMMEVDIDGSHTIDFFEYLQVADMLVSKKGRSLVFRSSFIKKEGRHVSKTCVMM